MLRCACHSLAQLTATCMRLAQVGKGGPKAAAVAQEGPAPTLFLCYPPPASPMAADCLRSFGRVLCWPACAHMALENAPAACVCICMLGHCMHHHS
jgi:hypothetical protein